jgi:transposase
MAQKRLQEEKQHHREAFELYYIMPKDKRSVREVARQLNRAPSTIQTWAQSFNWQERAEIRDSQVQQRFKEVQAANDDTLVNIKASFHKILKALIAEAISDVKLKKLKIDNVNELLRVMEMDMNLLGEEDRRAHNQLNDLTEAIKASVQMFNNGEDFVYDGNDRIPEDGEDDDGSNT